MIKKVRNIRYKIVEEMQIRLLPDGIMPTSKNGDWIDCYTRFDCKLNWMELGVLRLGFTAKLPSGYEAIVAPRSSLTKNFGVICSNSFGIIDENYCGDTDEWLFPVLCVNEWGTIIPKGSRVCQFRIITHQPKINYKIVDKMEGESRGGYGSTGVN